MKFVFPGFPQETLGFFRELKQNNNREWFLAHKEIYEQKAKSPMILFIEALKTESKRFAPEILFDAKCIYRIYRDVRFSRDKSPYKTHIAAAFDPKQMQKRPCAGLYFHLEPDQVLIGGGIYMPGSAELLAIRRHIQKHYKKLQAIVREPEFKKLFERLKGKQLSRVPKGFRADHPAAGLLRYKQFLAYITLRSDVAGTPNLLPLTVKYFRTMMPLIRFLNTPLKNLPTKLRTFL